MVQNEIAPASAAARPTGVATTATYLPELEGLRGIAMLLVLVFHTDALLSFGQPGIPNEAVSPALALVRNGGDLGVDLFFVLSSFLLTLPFFRGALAGTSPSIRRYGERRALRILPLYYLAVVVATLFSVRQAADLLHGLPYLVFLNAVPGLTEPLLPFSGVWWSLATEAEFYIVLAAAAWLCRTRSGRAVAMGGLALWAASYTAWVAGKLMLHTIAGQFALGFSLFGRAPSFLAGSLVAALYARYGAVWRRGVIAADAAVLAVVVALAFMAQWVVSFGQVRTQTVPWHAYHIVEAALCAMLVWLMVATPTHARRLLKTWSLLMLGVLSYSMYVWHFPVLAAALLAVSWAGLSLAGWTWLGSVVAAGAWLTCVALSTLTYRAIERPFLRRKELLPSGP